MALVEMGDWPRVNDPTVSNPVVDPVAKYTTSSRALGTLYTVYQDYDTTDVWLSTSVNHGDTWTGEKVWDAGTHTAHVHGGPHIWLHPVNNTVFITFTVRDSSSVPVLFLVENDTVLGTWTIHDLTFFDLSAHSYKQWGLQCPQVIGVWDSGNSRYQLYLYCQTLGETGFTNYVGIYYISRDEDATPTPSWGSPISPARLAWTYGSLMLSSHTSNSQTLYINVVPGTTNMFFTYTRWRGWTGSGYYRMMPYIKYCTAPTNWGVNVEMGGSMNSRRVSPAVPVYTSGTGRLHIAFLGTSQHGDDDSKTYQYYMHWGYSLTSAGDDQGDDGKIVIHVPPSVGTYSTTFPCVATEAHTAGKVLHYVFHREFITGQKFSLMYKTAKFTGNYYDGDDWLPEAASQLLDYGGSTYPNHPDSEETYRNAIHNGDIAEIQLFGHDDVDQHPIAKGFAGVARVVSFDDENGKLVFFKAPDTYFTLPTTTTLALTSHVHPYIALKDTGYVSDTSTASSTTTVIDATTGGYTPGVLVGKKIHFSSGTEAGEGRDITANTAGTITVNPPFDAAPGNTDAFQTMEPDSFTIDPRWFTNLYEDGTGYSYAILHYTNYFTSTLTSVVFTPTTSNGTFEIAPGSVGDTWEDEPGSGYGSTHTQNTWVAGEANTICLWVRWQNTGTPAYGPTAFEIDVAVTE